MKYSIESPYSNGKAFLKKEIKTRPFRKEDFQIWEHYYVCEKTNKEFTTSQLDELNISQVYNQYRAKYAFLFPKEITQLREDYGLNISQLSKILGVGINMIRNYENGEMPSTSNANLLSILKKPQIFQEIFQEKINLLNINEKKTNKIYNNIDALIKKQEKAKSNCLPIQNHPNEYTGYQIPNFEKLAYMTIFFLSNLDHLFKVKLNKLLFYSDFTFFKENGYSISGIKYSAIPMGPVPEKYLHLYASMVDMGYVENKEIVSKEFKQSLEKMIPIKPFNKDIFTNDEIKTLNNILSNLGFKSRKEIVELSHSEKCWTDLEKSKGTISYQKYAFELNEIK